MELLSTEEFYIMIKKSTRKIIFFFTADWCGDCQFIKPVMPEIIENNSEIDFVEVNRDKFIDLCGDLAIYGIPSFVAFENGEETGRFVSKDRKTKEEIQQFIAAL